MFALANAGVTLGEINIVQSLTSPVSLGVAFGLVLGKPVGIGLFSYFLVRTRLAVLSAGVSWPQILGAGMLGGIGFTMSLFIASLSFSDPLLLDSTKVGILLASLISGVLGVSFLAAFGVKRKEK
jgi:NhaA family Na+:H+ antiporter